MQLWEQRGWNPALVTTRRDDTGAGDQPEAWMSLDQTFLLSQASPEVPLREGIYSFCFSTSVRNADIDPSLTSGYKKRFRSGQRCQGLYGGLLLCEVTVTQHESVVLLLPAKTFLTPHAVCKSPIRWTCNAKDICHFPRIRDAWREEPLWEDQDHDSSMAWQMMWKGLWGFCYLWQVGPSFLSSVSDC